MIRSNVFDVAKKVNRPLLLDGAMGSLLENKRIIAKDLLWSARANIENPEEVLRIHEAYIAAGTDIITTNTFRTNPHTLEQKGISNFSRYIKSAVRIANGAVDDKNILIAGSNPPAEDCYQIQRTISKSKLKLNHSYHIEKLYDNDIHFILNETQSHLDEIKYISEFCSKHDIDYVMSLYVTTNLNILSGENLDEVVKLVLSYNPMAISFNCINATVFSKIYQKIDAGLKWGAYLNCLSSKQNNSELFIDVSPKSYSDLFIKYLTKKPSFLGSCCGSTPEFTKSMRTMIDENT